MIGGWERGSRRQQRPSCCTMHPPAATPPLLKGRARCRPETKLSSNFKAIPARPPLLPAQLVVLAAGTNDFHAPALLPPLGEWVDRYLSFVRQVSGTLQWYLVGTGTTVPCSSILQVLWYLVVVSGRYI